MHSNEIKTIGILANNKRETNLISEIEILKPRMERTEEFIIYNM